jgi:hypothetical protein
MAKPDRKRMDEVLLRNALGLDDDWLNRDEDGVAHLPTRLPSFIRQGHSERDVGQVEAAVNRLVSAGCRRQALYFCLQELSPAAERSRRGQEWAFLKDKQNTDPEELRIKPLKLASKEDVKVVANHAKRALRVIREYRRELLLAHEATKSRLPRGLIVAAPDAGEAISLLLASLAWVRELANSYVAPFETTLLKSKGLFCLTLYVSMYADAARLKSAQQRAESERPGVHLRKQRHTKRDALPEHALANIASVCTGHHRAPSDLNAKLKRFEKDYPALHKTMKTKMAALHRAATE